MCNCGNKRTEMVNQVFNAGQEPIQAPAKKMWPDISFSYTGRSALTVTGAVTGKTYRFTAPGVQQLIDYRDAPAMMMVPVLKRVV
ncbi:MAG: hypothetical protein ABIQ88_00860 [Chitinophagaceae bacterium]